MPGGANKVSLIEAQHNYQDFGACDPHGRRYVRPPAEDEPLDPAWRRIDPTRDSFEDWEAEGWETGDRAPWPDDRTVLCWWLPTFWRREHRASQDGKKPGARTPGDGELGPFRPARPSGRRHGGGSPATH
ncbi:CPCC family cysteine-rich protein [Streptomyces sp. NPDC091292]|uniref:CPCC family cysteine-rich protein n=1 Tax=Streptomyces sp. NPDC091292 TaxID=3365991 RepID=UPI00380549A3